jgi:uncharacterized protein YecT (DUF1311 family)
MTRIIFLFALLLTIRGYSQSTETKMTEFPIDISLKGCLDSAENQTTVGMMDCGGRARESWDREMNKYYKLLMQQLNENEKAKLRAAQKKWLEYRDAEFENAGAIYYGMEGTMWRIVAVNTQMNLVRQRALDLQSYYENLTFDK